MSNFEEHVSGDEVRDAINRYNQDMTESNLMEVARLLKDAWMWIPCTMYLSDNDQKRLSEFIANVGGDKDSLKEFKPMDEAKMVPDTYEQGDEKFLLVFTHEEEMMEYDDSMAKVKRPFMEAIEIAKNSNNTITGIAINAFKTGVVVSSDLWEFFENMQ